MNNHVRNIFRRLYFSAFPGGIRFIKNVDIAYNVGERSRIYPQAVINNPSGCKSRISIGKYTHVAGMLTVWGNCGFIEIGDYCFIGENTRVYAAERVRIGNRVQIAHGCNIFDSNIHSINPTERHKEYIQNTTGGLYKLFDLNESEVVIKDDAWIGACVIILKGVTIGVSSIVGAGSVVTTDVSDYSVAAGNPARVIRSIYA